MKGYTPHPRKKSVIDVPIKRHAWPFDFSRCKLHLQENDRDVQAAVEKWAFECAVLKLDTLEGCMGPGKTGYPNK